MKKNWFSNEILTKKENTILIWFLAFEHQNFLQHASTPGMTTAAVLTCNNTEVNFDRLMRNLSRGRSLTCPVEKKARTQRPSCKILNYSPQFLRCLNWNFELDNCKKIFWSMVGGERKTRRTNQHISWIKIMVWFRLNTNVTCNLWNVHWSNFNCIANINYFAKPMTTTDGGAYRILLECSCA